MRILGLADEFQRICFMQKKYVMQFMEFLKYLEYTENDLYPFGLLLAPDIQKWQRELDSILVQELNDISFEIEHHEGKKWEHEKELLKDEYKKPFFMV